MIPLLLIRHGPTDWTEAGRLQGRVDQPLSELGRELLRRRELPPEFLAWDWISSPLQRAVETGLILRGMLARLDHALIERDAGEFEGLTRAELEAQSAALRLREGLDWCPPGGESPRQVMARLSPWLLRLWNTLVDHSERYRKIRMLRPQAARPKARNVAAEHAAMADAALKRDCARALELMDAHLTATERAVARHLEPKSPPRRATSR